jgi:hypothetical protein
MQLFVTGATLSLYLLIAAGCSPPTTPDSSATDDKSAVSSIEDQQPDMDALKRWVDSLSGKSIDDIRRIFSETAPLEDTWRHEDQGGKQLSYEFPNYEIEFYFSDGNVVLVSIDMFPE